MPSDGGVSSIIQSKVKIDLRSAEEFNRFLTLQTPGYETSTGNSVPRTGNVLAKRHWVLWPTTFSRWQEVRLMGHTWKGSSQGCWENQLMTLYNVLAVSQAWLSVFGGFIETDWCMKTNAHNGPLVKLMRSGTILYPAKEFEFVKETALGRLKLKDLKL